MRLENEKSSDAFNVVGDFIVEPIDRGNILLTGVLDLVKLLSQVFIVLLEEVSALNYVSVRVVLEGSLCFSGVIDTRVFFLVGKFVHA